MFGKNSPPVVQTQAPAPIPLTDSTPIVVASPVSSSSSTNSNTMKKSRPEEKEEIIKKVIVDEVEKIGEDLKDAIGVRNQAH